MGRFANMVQHAFRSMSYMPLAFITAKTGKNVKALLNLSQSLFKQAQQRVSTGTLNRILREAVRPTSRLHATTGHPVFTTPLRSVSRRRPSSCL